jgi:hypothetical protein
MSYAPTEKWKLAGIVIAMGVMMIFAMPRNVKQNSDNREKGMVIVELFTSEGCSSCPAADDAVAAIAEKFPGQVYVLGFHVDYWNRLGWKDEFSEAKYTIRQREYASFFSVNSIYTPQVVVNGKRELVGSDKIALNAIISAELNKAKPFGVKLSAVGLSDRIVSVKFITDANENNNLNIALIQARATTNVKRGENQGRTLSHINIVRDFKSVSLAKEKSGAVVFTIPKELNIGQCKIIAFLQDKTNFEVNGVAHASVL